MAQKTKNSMTDAKLYYTAPIDELFEEMKKACMEQWATHDNKYGYVDEKTSRIKDINNIKDNFMYMLAMFDIYGQHAVLNKISSEARQAVRERMVSGGADTYHLADMGLWNSVIY